MESINIYKTQNKNSDMSRKEQSSETLNYTNIHKSFWVVYNFC